MRIMPSSGPSSLPMRFWPPSPRVSERYAVSTWRPFASQAMRRVSSSSGCAPITSTRAVVPSPSTNSPNAAAPRACATCATCACERGATARIRQVATIARFDTRLPLFGFMLARRLARRAGLSLRRRRVGQRLSKNARLLRVVRGLVPFRRARSLGTADVAQRRQRADRRAQPRMHVRPPAHVLRLFLRPDDFFDVRVEVDQLTDLARPRRQLFDAHERDVRRPLARGDEIVEDLARAEDQALHLLAVVPPPPDRRSPA